MKEYQNLKIENKRFNSNVEIRNKKFRKCYFDDCALSFPYNLIPEDRTRMIDCVFEDCEFNGRSCFQNKGYLKNVLFKNVKNSDYMRIGGVIFDKVTFKGKIDKWILDSGHRGMVINYDSITEAEWTILDKYAQAQYKKIEWALDISEAEFKECDLRGSIPAQLIKYNPETQALVKYDKLIKNNWKSNSSIIENIAQVFCNWTFQEKRDMIIVAPVRNKKLFAEYMEGIKILRAEGIAEPD